ncbi:unnamed protein product [Gongylonema pulchrum]|uniref:THO complex subunit 2 n=1 Tax=Gongylonema pulchrum TaxID=637853 RepID=A0A183EC00_9BILA|nr:unnamed protein product [Gongylonema pulchrum]
MASINESDLIAFLNQFSTEALFAKAVRHFAISLRSSVIDQILTLVAFELVLLKIFNDGLRTYDRPKFRQFCKQIGYVLRQSVRCLAEVFKITKGMLSSDELQIVQKDLGLWQFLVDLPYDIVSDSCRMRCQILLRRKVTMTVSQLYELREVDLPHLVKTAGSLLDKLPDLPNNDGNFMVSALAAIISVSDIDVDSFAVELINVCFLDVSMRDHFYKVGSEAIGVLIDKHPRILQKILLLIDRNLDTLDEYAVEVLSTAPLSKRVLGSMNWGIDVDGQLWLPQKVHAVCADTIVKGHMAQCKATNGLISKSWNKVAKLASKVPDYEQQFDAFCWDILLRLKLPLETRNLSVMSINDLASFYVFVVQRSLISVDEFLSSGLPLWSELITSGCYAASVVILARLISSFPDAVGRLISQPNFTQCLDRLFLYDQSSYAVKLIAGDSKFPGPTVRLLASAVTVTVSLLGLTRGLEIRG